VLVPEAKLSSKDAAFAHILAAWPELGLVLRAASASRPKRFRIEVEAVMEAARLAFAAALIAWRNTDGGVASQAVRDARRPGCITLAELARGGATSQRTVPRSAVGR
jgi:hypothetical protein